MAVYKKLLEIQKVVRAMRKDERAFNYDYLKGDTILSVVRPKMDELGLLLMPEVIDMKLEPQVYETYNRQAKCNVMKTEILCSLAIRFTWVDTEDGEMVEQMWAATGQNDFDKSFGSALTYGERYYLLKLFHIQTDRDDVDAISADRDRNRAESAENRTKSSQSRVGSVSGAKVSNSPQNGAKTGKMNLVRYSVAYNKAVERMANGEDMSQLNDFYHMNEAIWNALQNDVKAYNDNGGRHINALQS